MKGPDRLGAAAERLERARAAAAVVAVAVADGRITGLFNQVNPEKLSLGDLE